MLLMVSIEHVNNTQCVAELFIESGNVCGWGYNGDGRLGIGSATSGRVCFYLI